ncbi:RICIN domain-containing protein [Streptomyces massasporeus]
MDVTGVSVRTAHPCNCGPTPGGGNQQWRPVREADGSYHFVARHSGKCLRTG